MALHPHLSDLAVVGEIVFVLWKIRLGESTASLIFEQLVKIVRTPRHLGLPPRNVGAAKDVSVGMHGARNVDVLPSGDGNPDWLMESALLEGEFGTVILGAIGVRATLPGEVFVAVVFEGLEFIHLGGGLLGRFVHCFSFPTGSRPIYSENTVVSEFCLAIVGIFLFW
jgi:hypothetical protein